MQRLIELLEAIQIKKAANAPFGVILLLEDLIADQAEIVRDRADVHAAKTLVVF